MRYYARSMRDIRAMSIVGFSKEYALFEKVHIADLKLQAKLAGAKF